MNSRAIPHYACLDPGSSTASQPAAIITRIFHPNLLELACDAVISAFASSISAKFEPFARSCIIQNVADSIRCLTVPSIPLTVTELCTRIVTGMPLKLRPDEKALDEYRVLAERRCRKQAVALLQPVADKIAANMRAVDGRVDASTTFLFVQVLEHILSSVVQTALNYRSELGPLSDCTITVVDIQHIFSLLGSSSAESLSGKGGGRGEVPVVRRIADSYEGCLRDLQAFLKECNCSLSLAVHVFYEPLSAILASLASANSSSSESTYSPPVDSELAAAANAALSVFKMAKSLLGDLNILAEVSDDIFDSTAHLLSYCLQEPAEEDLYQGFAYYAETLFASDCHWWASRLSECPKVFSVLRRCHRRMVNTIYKQVSRRHFPGLEVLFADPHACPLCLATVPEPVNYSFITLASGHSISSGNSSGSSSTAGGLFSRPVFHRLSSTKSPTPLQQHQQQLLYATSSSSSGERSPPGGPPHVHHPAAGGAPPLGGGSRTCSQMVIAFRYLLPRLLLMPVYQILYLADLLDELCTLPNQKAQEQAILRDAASMLYKTRKAVALELSRATAASCWLHAHLPRLPLLLRTPLTARPTYLLPPEAQLRLVEVVNAANNLANSTTAAGSTTTSSSGGGSYADHSHCKLSPNDFIMSGVVQVRQSPAKAGLSDRVAYLFTDCLLLLKRPSGQRRMGGGAIITNVAMAAAAALTNPVASISPATCGSSGLVLKKDVPLAHFHLTDLGMQLNPDTGEPAYLFELEYWRDVTLVHRHHHKGMKSDGRTKGSGTAAAAAASGSSSKHNPERPPFSTFSLPKQGSAVNLSALAQPLTQRLSGSSTALDTLGLDADVLCGSSNAATANEANLSAVCCSDTIANSSAPAKKIVFSLKTTEEKADWMATLISIQRRGIFKRFLRELPKQEIPLILPDPEQYCFAVPDSSQNILFEPPGSDNSMEIAVIRAATVNKLIERVTSHACFDSRTIRTFLQTYRRYLTASDLLDLLIERFNMPRPDFERALQASLENEGTEEATRSFSDVGSLIPRMELRFNSSYKRRIQYRVLSFIKKWVRNASYFKVDFADNGELQGRLEAFLNCIDAVPSLAENVTAILRCLHGDRAKVVQVIRQCAPERLDLGLAITFDRVRLTNVHPLELARQVTLYEWNLYSRIEFNEINGSEKNWGVNMRRSIDFSNRFLKWLIWSILSHRSMEDRVLVLQRVLDLLLLFEAIGNLQGTQEARAALQSSPVHRLSETFSVLWSKSRSHHRALLDALRPADVGEAELLAAPEDYIAAYEQLLRRIDPPAVPFIAVGGQTRLIHIELKLPDYVPGGALGAPLINFAKCQQIADLKEQYLSFQMIPFNLQPDPVIQDFLKYLDPHALAGVADENEFEDLMYQQSLSIQPRDGATGDSRSMPPPETSTMNCQLTATEVRVGGMLSAGPVEVQMQPGCREFRQLLAVTAPSPDAKYNLAAAAPLPPPPPTRGAGTGGSDSLSHGVHILPVREQSPVSPPQMQNPDTPPPPLPPKPAVPLILETSPEPPEGAVRTVAAPPPPLPPRACTSSLAADQCYCWDIDNQYQQFGEVDRPTASMERWLQLGTRREPTAPPPPPPPKSTGTVGNRSSLPPRKSDDSAPELPPRTIQLSRSQVTSPTPHGYFLYDPNPPPPPLPPKKRPKKRLSLPGL